MVTTRFARLSDVPVLASLRNALWPDGSVEEHLRELESILAGGWSTMFPYVVMVAEAKDGRIAGFAELTLRSRADGCDPAQPVAYLEGWFVSATDRRQRVGAALMRAGELWARQQGCREMGSDTWLDAEVSQRAHEALGFEVVDRCVHYRKKL